MTARLAILDIMTDMEGDAPDRTLLSALTVVSPMRQIEIVRLLIDRAQPVGLQGLPPLMGKLEPAARRLVIENSDRLFSALRTCARSSNAQTRQNSLEIISESGDARLAYLAAHAIHDGSPRIRSHAAATLLRLSRRQLEDTRRVITALDPANTADAASCRELAATLHGVASRREYIVNALGEALEHYESHHRPEVVEAAMPFALDLEPSLLKQSTIKRGKLSHAIEEILSDRLLPEHAPFVYVAMAFPELRRKVVAILGRCRDNAFFCEFIRWHWVGRDPNIRKHLAAIRQLTWLNDGFETTFNLPADVAAAAPSWLLPLGIPVGQKISLLLNLLILDDVDANRAAVWALTRIDSPDCTTAMQGLLDHDREEVRRIARIELDRRDRGRHRAPVPRSLKTRPEDWATLLQSAGVSEEFESVWQNFERLDAGLAGKAGPHALTFITNFAMRLQTKLLAKSPADRLRAMRIVRTLSLGAKFEKDVYTATNDADTEIRRTAVATLGQIEGETTRRILERSLVDEAPEVRAAAIDSVEALQLPNARTLVEPLTDSEDADVRAAATRCLLRQRVPEAARSLMKMLIDPRPDHRCSALWIVDQLKLYTLEARIRQIAEIDPDARIARIAEHVAKRLSQANPKKAPSTGAGATS
ncbi:MAG: HEAT repeat domain-containing protein [Phycisphaerales bacterium]|nr:HEAT repeat domain-containing protein [Phycisphaerales bacterium]MCB9855947.1 HEAT repeat domain-containing protein [Phycisphaerales bacterium]MCB9864072.1 HEAT repeat domain-containing protein [Phycisphaerales bacterium]